VDDPETVWLVCAVIGLEVEDVITPRLRVEDIPEDV
jgi:hypothetical protein